MKRVIRNTVKEGTAHRYYNAAGQFIGETRKLGFGKYCYTGPTRQGTARTRGGARRALLKP